jgi:hypothetical protein
LKEDCWAAWRAPVPANTAQAGASESPGARPGGWRAGVAAGPAASAQRPGPDQQEKDAAIARKLPSSLELARDGGRLCP